MAIKGVLAQAYPEANILTGIYTVPSGILTTVALITATNQSGSTVTFRISVAINNAADDRKQYISRDTEICSNGSIDRNLGVPLNAGDVIRVQSSSGTVSFNVYGSELNLIV